MGRSIVFLSDFGYRNEWVGICHTVIDGIAPGVPVIDLSHSIAPLDVRAGALLLRDSIRFLAPSAIALAVVDPSVGTDRDLAVRTTDGRLLVGPDNGLLAPAWEAAGGLSSAVSIESPAVVLDPVSPSFHARDVLAPAAAHLAAGTPLEELGPSVPPESLATLTIPEPDVERGKIVCEVLDLNRFGNVQLNVRREHLAAAALDGADRLAVEGHAAGCVARVVSTYADLQPGAWGVMIDPRGWLSVIRGNPGNAAEGLEVSNGDLIWVTAAPGA